MGFRGWVGSAASNWEWSWSMSNLFTFKYSDKDSVAQLSDRSVNFPDCGRLAWRLRCVDNSACFLVAKLSLSGGKLHATQF